MSFCMITTFLLNIENIIYTLFNKQCILYRNINSIKYDNFMIEDKLR